MVRHIVNEQTYADIRVWMTHIIAQLHYCAEQKHVIALSFGKIDETTRRRIEKLYLECKWTDIPLFPQEDRASRRPDRERSTTMVNVAKEFKLRAILSSLRVKIYSVGIAVNEIMKRLSISTDIVVRLPHYRDWNKTTNVKGVIAALHFDRAWTSTFLMNTQQKEVTRLTKYPRGKVHTQEDRPEHSKKIRGSLTKEIKPDVDSTKYQEHALWLLENLQSINESTIIAFSNAKDSERKESTRAGNRILTLHKFGLVDIPLFPDEIHDSDGHSTQTSKVRTLMATIIKDIGVWELIERLPNRLLIVGSEARILLCKLDLDFVQRIPGTSHYSEWDRSEYIDDVFRALTDIFVKFMDFDEYKQWLNSTHETDGSRAAHRAAAVSAPVRRALIAARERKTNSIKRKIISALDEIGQDATVKDIHAKLQRKGHVHDTARLINSILNRADLDTSDRTRLQTLRRGTRPTPQHIIDKKQKSLQKLLAIVTEVLQLKPNATWHDVHKLQNERRVVKLINVQSERMQEIVADQTLTVEERAPFAAVVANSLWSENRG
jgi:hypothetical protein